MQAQNMAAKGSFLEECMFEALLLLLQQKPYDKISITEIARKAGVSRMTYYRNYTSKDEIFTKFFDKNFSTHLQSLKEAGKSDGGRGVNIYGFALSYFRHNRSFNYFWHRSRLDEHLESSIIKVLIEKINQYLYDIFMQVHFEELKYPLNGYEAAYIAGGLSNLSRYWVRNNFRETPEEMATAFCQLSLTKKQSDKSN